MFVKVTSKLKRLWKSLFWHQKSGGFFQVVNHGIPQELLDNMIEGTKIFHKQEAESKKQFYSRDFQSKKVTYFSNHDLYNSNAANWRDI